MSSWKTPLKHQVQSIMTMVIMIATIMVTIIDRMRGSPVLHVRWSHKNASKPEVVHACACDIQSYSIIFHIHSLLKCLKCAFPHGAMAHGCHGCQVLPKRIKQMRDAWGTWLAHAAAIAPVVAPVVIPLKILWFGRSFESWGWKGCIVLYSYNML